MKATTIQDYHPISYGTALISCPSFFSSLLIERQRITSGGIQTFYKPVLSQKFFFSTGSVLTNGTNLNGNAQI